MPDKYDPDELIGTTEAGKIIGVNARQVANYIKDELLPASKVGATHIIRRGDLEGFVRPKKTGRPKSKR